MTLPIYLAHQTPSAHVSPIVYGRDWGCIVRDLDTIVLVLLAWHYLVLLATIANGVLFLMFAEYCLAMCGACTGTLVTWPLLRLGMIQCCALRLWSPSHVRAEQLVPGFGRTVLLCWGKKPRTRGMAAYIRLGYGAFRQPKFECGCCEMLLLGCVVRDRIFMYSVFTATLI